MQRLRRCVWVCLSAGPRCHVLTIMLISCGLWVSVPDLLRTRAEPEQDLEDAALAALADELGVPTDPKALEVCGQGTTGRVCDVAVRLTR